MKHTSWDQVAAEVMSPLIRRQAIHGEHSTDARFFLAKGAFVARHSHASEQWTRVSSGKLRLIFDTGDVTVHPGEMVYIPPNEPHAAEAVEDTWVLDTFAPRRDDWIRNADSYLRR